MKILAVDTSSKVAAIAVKRDNLLLGEYNLNYEKNHSQKLMPMIMHLLKNLNMEPDDIDVYSASSGPGSFTGLRIGIVTVKTLAYTVQKPVVSVSTLDALAYNLPKSNDLICPIMDARNNQVYTAIYSWVEDKFTRESKYEALQVDELIKKITYKNKHVVFIGDAVPVHRNKLRDELCEGCSFAPDNLLLQKASSVAELALKKYYCGIYESAFDMKPFYLRQSQAEREYIRKQAYEKNV